MIYNIIIRANIRFIGFIKMFLMVRLPNDIELMLIFVVTFL